MLKIDRQKVKKNKFPIALLLIELITAILVVHLFYKIIGFQVNFEARSVSIAPAAEPLLLFFFAISIALLVAVYFTIKKKLPGLFQAQEQAKVTIKEKTKEKLSKAKTDPKAAALLLIQFIFVFAVAMAIFAWADPELELIPWSKAGVAPPITTILNAIIAIIVLAFFYYLYSFTAWYRK